MRDFKKDFPIYNKYPNLIYLDSAASALKTNQVITAMVDYYQNNGTNVHRGAYFLSVEATNLYEQARLTIANFINANENEVVFTKGTTHGLNIVANHFSNILTNEDEVIVSELEHHSSLLPLINACKKTGATLKYVELTKDGKITVENFKKVLTSKTKVVSLTLVSNVLGFLTPINDIIQVSHEVGALVIVDAAQAISHMPIDVEKMDCDFLTFSGHKIYGPNGIGILYGKQELLDNLTPFEFGGEMVLEVTKDFIEFMPSPLRFEAGTPPIAEAIGLAAAINYINDVTYDEIIKHTDLLKEYTVKKLSDINGVTIYNKNSFAPLITFNVGTIHPHDVSSYLDGKKNICLRSGKHCAHLVADFLNVNSTLRVSFNIYNTISDCDLFIETVKDAIDFFEGEF